MKYIKWGVIGNDDNHLRNVATLLSSVDGSSVELVANSTQSDIIDVVSRTDINSVYIATPISTRATNAIVAMNADKNVFVEHPFALSYDDGIRVNTIQEKTKLPCFVNCFSRYIPYFVKVKNLLREETIGNVVHISLRYWRKSENPLSVNDSNTLLRNICTNHVDLLQYLVGVVVEAKGLDRHDYRLFNNSEIAQICSSFLLENGVTVSASWCIGMYSAVKSSVIEIIGDEGMISFSLDLDSPVLLKTNDEKLINVDVDNERAMLPLFKSVIESLQGFTVCNATSVSATPSIWVVDQILNN